jgi:hypothetical protein
MAVGINYNPTGRSSVVPQPLIADTDFETIRVELPAEKSSAPSEEQSFQSF